jgi:hypothetical protein
MRIFAVAGLEEVVLKEKLPIVGDVSMVETKQLMIQRVRNDL